MSEFEPTKSQKHTVSGAALYVKLDNGAIKQVILTNKNILDILNLCKEDGKAALHSATEKEPMFLHFVMLPVNKDTI
jgi:hypothetical protein